MGGCARPSQCTVERGAQAGAFGTEPAHAAVPFPPGMAAGARPGVEAGAPWRDGWRAPRRLPPRRRMFSWEREQPDIPGGCQQPPRLPGWDGAAPAGYCGPSQRVVWPGRVWRPSGRDPRRAAAGGCPHHEGYSPLGRSPPRARSPVGVGPPVRTVVPAEVAAGPDPTLFSFFVFFRRPSFLLFLSFTTACGCDGREPRPGRGWVCTVQYISETEIYTGSASVSLRAIADRYFYGRRRAQPSVQGGGRAARGPEGGRGGGGGGHPPPQGGESRRGAPRPARGGGAGSRPR